MLVKIWLVSTTFWVLIQLFLQLQGCLSCIRFPQLKIQLPFLLLL
jgi:hypothetical protein